MRHEVPQIILVRRNHQPPIHVILELNLSVRGWQREVVGYSGPVRLCIQSVGVFWVGLARTVETLQRGVVILAILNPVPFVPSTAVRFSLEYSSESFEVVTSLVRSPRLLPELSDGTDDKGGHATEVGQLPPVARGASGSGESSRRRLHCACRRRAG